VKFARYTEAARKRLWVATALVVAAFSTGCGDDARTAPDGGADTNEDAGAEGCDLWGSNDADELVMTADWASCAEPAWPAMIVFGGPVEWDPSTQLARVNVTIGFHGDVGDTCPNGMTQCAEYIDGGAQTIFCLLPRLPAPLDCDEAIGQYPYDSTEFGWFYSEGCTGPETIVDYAIVFTQAGCLAALGKDLIVWVVVLP
jgi:hypothetical protein